MATQVQMWASADGRVFQTEDEANQHDHALKEFNIAKNIGNHLNVTGIEPATVELFRSKHGRHLIHALLRLTEDSSNS